MTTINALHRSLARWRASVVSISEACLVRQAGVCLKEIRVHLGPVGCVRTSARCFVFGTLVVALAGRWTVQSRSSLQRPDRVARVESESVRGNENW